LAASHGGLAQWGGPFRYGKPGVTGESLLTGHGAIATVDITRGMYLSGPVDGRE
jgi:hypothetical protein